MSTVSIARVPTAAPEDIARQPLIFTGVIESWSSWGKWSFEHFRKHHYHDWGLVHASFFDNLGGMATKLGVFIDHLDKPLAEMPGFWLDARGEPCDERPAEYQADPWSFSLSLLKLHPELRREIEPFPPGIPNLLANMPVAMQDLVQTVCQRDLHSLYLSRAGTETPFHRDFFNSTGCLVQFEGRKAVRLVAGDAGFHPEDPDPRVAVHTATLEPGEMLIVPPGWWHWVKALDHSLTLSINYFSEHNLPIFLASMLKQVCEMKQPDRLARKIETCLGEFA